jgi:aldehyde:ferredoxin oxidoreductase
MAKVYAGKLLRIDLDEGGWETQGIAEEDVQRYLLGSGLAAKIFYQEMDPALDPLDPANPLIFMDGLLTGSIAPAACRLSVCGCSPLTRIWNESLVGGYFGAELRFAGYDGLFFKGRAKRPVYLWLEDDHIEIRDATSLWGLDSYETEERVREETDPRAQVACVGLAGENLVPIAGVVFGGRETRMAGRGGMGALMASKNLKAIAVRGTKRPTYHDPKGLRRAVREANGWIRENSISMSKFGTGGGVPNAESYGDLPLKNWLLGSWKEGAEKTSGQRIVETIFSKDYRCFGCPIGCGKDIRIEEGPYAGLEGHGPEYETLAAFGGLLLNDDLNAIAKANDLCNRYGLDSISTGAVIALAMEAYEKGLITTEGIELTWGNPEAIVRLVEMIAHREGIGDLLASGARAAAERLGEEELAIQVKGLEIPMHDPRAFIGMAANYATANRGGCHLEGLTYWYGYGVRWPGWDGGWESNPHTSLGKGKLAYDFQNYISVYNPLGLCKFIAKAGVEPSHLAEWVNLAMGWNWTKDEVLRTGERLFNLKRLINVRLGVSAKDDTLPQRLLTHPRPSGKAEGVLPDLDLMLREYYQLRGWTSDGFPSEAKVKEVGLA